MKKSSSYEWRVLQITMKSESIIVNQSIIINGD